MEIKLKEKKVNLKENFLTYWSFLKKYKFLFFVILFLAFLQEGKQVFDNFLVKLLFDRSADFISGTIQATDFSKAITVVLFFLIGTTLLSVISNWLKEHFLVKVDTSTVYDLKQKYFSHIVLLDHKFFTTHKTGSLISRMGRGGKAIEGLTDSIIYQFFPFLIQFSIIVFSLIYLNLSSAIIVFIMVGSFLAFNLGTQRVRNKARLIANKAEDAEKANIADTLTNIDSVKYFGKERWTIKRHLNFARDSRDTAKKSYNYWRLVTSVNSMIIGSGVVLLLYFSLNSFLRGEITLGTLSFIYTTFVSLIGPMFGFIHSFRSFNNYMTDLQDLFEYGNIESNIKDKASAKNIRIKKGEIDFENVDFSYDKRKIFQEFSLKIPSNKKIALVGHSGCGKSSLVKILYRLYDIQSGSIKVDGIDIRDIKQESLRSEMSIVPQECILFDDTIYNNILFSNPQASRKEVLDAIKFARLDKIISSFPYKENTIVGERGIKLSGGEKQRVSIARAILANKKILVLDEATSALDSETEFEIQQSLKELMKGRTTIVIAHRLSTIMSSDTIVVMKKGKIIQMGKHSELIRRDGEYKKLWNLQKGGYLRG